MEIIAFAIEGECFEKWRRNWVVNFEVIFSDGRLTVVIGNHHLWSHEIAFKAGFSVSPLGGGIIVFKPFLAETEVEDRVYFRFFGDGGGVPHEVVDAIRPAVLALIQQESPWIVAVEDYPWLPEKDQVEKWGPVLSLLKKAE